MIELIPAPLLKAGDVFSTDGYTVTVVVLLPKTSRVFVQAERDGHLKTAAVPNEILLPIWSEEV